jgi:tetratricopeptide (TPR) repeat protein
MRRGLLLALLMVAAPAGAQEMWERNRGDCEQVFRNWRTSSLGKLRDCVQKWEMYRDVTQASNDDRAVANEAFDKLYQEGSERDAVMALSALKRLGLRPKKLRSESKAIPTDETPPDEEVRVVRPTPAPVVLEPDPAPTPEPTSMAKARQPDARTAKAAAQRGKALLQQGKLPEAVSELLIAADADPTYADPLYLAASAFVDLNQPDAAIQYLARMKAINSDRSRVLVRQAATDPRFKSIRHLAPFKDVTGTAMIQILNGAGPDGNKKVLDFKQRLEAVNMPVANVGADMNPRTATFIYFKPGFERQAEDMRRQLQLGLVQKKPLHWVSEYDVILVYGEVPKDKWVDDEAEKAGEEAKAKKKAEEDAKRKEEEKRKKDEEEMKKKLKMLEMLQKMESDPTGGATPPEGVPEAPSVP